MTQTNRSRLPFALRAGETESVSRAAIRIAFLAAIAALIWAHVTELPKIAYAEGRLEPGTALRRIEHPDGGIVAAVPVTEGEALEAGDVVLQLSETDIDAEAQSLAARATALQRTIRRTEDILSRVGADPARAAESTEIFDGVVAAQIAAYEVRRQRLAEQVRTRSDKIVAAEALVGNLVAQEDIARENETRFRELARRNNVTAVQVSERRQRLLEATGTRLRAQDALATARAEEIDARDALLEFHVQTRERLLADLSDAEDSLGLVHKAQAENALRRSRLTLRMPQEGIIQTLHVTTVGEVVDVGGLVAEFLPSGEELLATVQLRPIDAGHVSVGDPVQLRLTAFEAKRYGTLQGVVEHISATSTRNEEGSYLFKVLVRLERQTIGEGADRKPLRPGIEVNASIMTGTRSVLTYALEPVLAPFRQAFFER